MPFQQAVTATVTRSTSSAGISNLNNSIFISANAFFKERVKGYSSMSEVNADGGVPKDSNLYKAMQQAFSVGTTAVPIYAGRREVDSILLTPDLKSTTTYKFTFKSFDQSTGIYSESYNVSTESGITADADQIISDLVLDASTTLGIPTSLATFVDNSDGTLTILAGASQQIIVTDVEELTQTFTSTEDATTCYAEITDENKEDYYFVTSESRDETFVKALASAVETSTGSYPKQYRVSTSSLKSITTLQDPAESGDLLGQLKSGYTRTSTEWHQDSSTIFPELATCVKAGSYTTGKVNWKFLQNTAPVARHPILGRVLNTTEQGYIRDRNASWVGTELGLNFLHGGTNTTGTSEFTDLVQITDWVKLTMEARVLTALINANNGGVPITMRSGDLAIIKERCESVLSDGVNYKLFSGFVPITMPTSISFEDQAARILKDVKFTAYFASKVNFAIIDGNLTYNEEIV